MTWDDLKSWPGYVTVDGVLYPSISEASRLSINSLTYSSKIILHMNKDIDTDSTASTQNEPESKEQYRIFVKQYMTQPATDTFDFMAQWNNNVPMPLRVMVGTIERETRGMVFMNLHGDITETQSQYCMKCGKTITNPVSRYFGMGPECGQHNYVNPFHSDQELKEAVNAYRINYLRKIEWQGWIVKSAILSQERIGSIDE